MKRLLCATLLGAGAAAAQVPPHLGKPGLDDYRAYQSAHSHRAFAVAPGGAWGWKEDAATSEEAEAAALAACQANTAQKCVAYGLDGRVVFDAKAWPRLWGPYADATAAARAPVGRKPGERFFDLAFSDAEGRKLSVAALAGKVAVLHFWGSWCGPCRREMPDLQKLFESLRGRRDIVFVLLQVREKFADSHRWVEEQKLRLPLHDSGASGEADPLLRLAGGGSLRDRDIAASFPTTTVIDKRGIVVFSHVGPVADWSQYRDFLLDAAARSGR